MPDITIPDLVAAEYSKSQDCFHIQSLAEHIKDSLTSCMQKAENDYCLIGLFASEIETHLFIEKIKQKQNQLTPNEEG